MNSDGEGDEAAGGVGGGDHEVVAHLRAGVEGEERPGPSEGGSEPRHVGVPPLPQAGGGAEDRGGRWGEEDQAAQDMEEEAD